MPLTGNVTLAVLSALALLAVVATVLLWNRIRSWARWPARGSLIVLCQLTACTLVAALLNDANQFYGSWSELLGGGTGVSLSHVKAGARDKTLTEAMRRAKRLGRSVVVTSWVPEAGGTKAQQALVYLPAAYFSPTYADVQFPVVELLEGFPSTPQLWTGPLHLQKILDTEIASHRAVPFIAVVPTQNYLPGMHDGECINAVDGPQVESTLTTNVRQVIEHDFRAARDRSSWAVMGYSTGGFCALNIAIRHPSQYSVGVSLSGYDHPYVDATTGDLFKHNLAVRNLNDPLWRLQHLRPPPISLLLAASHFDKQAWRDAIELAGAVRAPTKVSALLLRRGAHNIPTWKAMEPTAFDWLSHLLAQPLAATASAFGQAPVPYEHQSAKRHHIVPTRHRIGPPLAAHHRAKSIRPLFQ
jgi:hypothetical protein